MSDLWEMLDAKRRQLRVAAGMTPEPTWRERFVDWWSDIDWSMVFIVVWSIAYLSCATVMFIAKLMLIKMSRADLVH
jgi:hypothetical protein